jgi:cytochrome c biogenesis protein CcmG/thiol:disulfide interchange protein DsbE
MSATPLPERPRRGPRLVLLIPLAVFVLLAAIFLVRLESGGDPDAIPSPLIGKAAPEFDLRPVAGLRDAAGVPVPGLSRADLLGKVSLVNIFGSWCVPCREEHPVLEKLATDSRFRLVGINYKDTDANAVRFLTDAGNPYAAIGVDDRSRTIIDWGGYGVPETFVVGRDGVIRYKFIGPLSPETVATTLMPEIEKALAN